MNAGASGAALARHQAPARGVGHNGAMGRTKRRAAAILAIIGLLFAPLALALHACPGGADMDATCANHCADGKVSLDTIKPPVPHAVAPVPALRVVVRHVVALLDPAFDSPYRPAAGPAPPLIRYTVLRI
jgi:hypothetical protein